MRASLDKYQAGLREFFIVSQIRLSDGPELKIEAAKADGEKCERCWNYSTRVGEVSEFPTVCERCSDALPEIVAAMGV